MTVFVALLRGINVGGKKKLPMKEFVSLCTGLGLSDVKTYIQSGNVVFRSDETDEKVLSAKISDAIAKQHGFSVPVLTLTRSALQAAIEANPFPEAQSEPKTLHLYFLAARPLAPAIDRLDACKKENERFQLIDNVFYLHAPDGIGRSKLAAKVEQAMGVSATARNWRTVEKIMTIANDLVCNPCRCSFSCDRSTCFLLRPRYLLRIIRCGAAAFLGLAIKVHMNYSLVDQSD